jgi:hypothetical protein
MTTILHWVGLVLALLVVAFAILGFWRGLSLRPTEPGSRAPDRLGGGGGGGRSEKPQALVFEVYTPGLRATLA